MAITVKPTTTETVAVVHGLASSSVTLPQGWRRVSDLPAGSDPLARSAIYRGPAPAADTVCDSLRAAYRNAAVSLGDIGVSRSRAVATVTVRYVSPVPGGHTPSKTDDTVSPDTYSLTPVLVPSALASHPVFEGIKASVLAAEDALSRGDLAGLAAEVWDDDGLVRKYLGLRMAGVTTWDGFAWKFQYSRHYAATQDISATLGTDIQNTGTVYGWSDVEGHYKIPEPKWKKRKSDGTTETKSFEWRFDGVGVSGSGDETVLTYTYTGVWQISALLYAGAGTFDPVFPPEG